MNYPVISPDLNLAENPTGQIKYNIKNRKRRRLTSVVELQAALLGMGCLPIREIGSLNGQIP
jgi:hypothetical protein